MSVFGLTVLVAGGAPSTEVDVVDVVSVGGVGRTRRGRGGVSLGYPGIAPLVVGGNVPAIVPGGCVVVAVDDSGGSVKFDVVSAFVPVIDTGGGVGSPGALIVDVTPLACPS